VGSAGGGDSDEGTFFSGGRGGGGAGDVLMGALTDIGTLPKRRMADGREGTRV